MPLLESFEDELRFVFITSEATVYPFANAPSDAVDTEMNDVKISVSRVSAEKCVRCWHHRTDVGSSVNHPELCSRCIENIEGGAESRKHA